MKINLLKSFCIVAVVGLVSLDSSAMPVPKGGRNQAFTASANGKYVTVGPGTDLSFGQRQVRQF